MHWKLTEAWAHGSASALDIIIAACKEDFMSGSEGGKVIVMSCLS